MFRWRWLQRKKTRSPSPPTKPKPEGKPVERFTGCTFCGSTSYYEGPTGGVAMNIKCADCGARFNIGLIPGGPILLEVLSPPTEEPYASNTKPKAT